MRIKSIRSVEVAFLGAVFLMLWACKPSTSIDEKLAALGKTPTQIESYKKGKAVYQAGCTSCHHSNPAMDGAVGPAILGSSKDLVEARVLRAEYPTGYQPKRSTRAMVALPQFKNDIEALAEFLSVGLP